MTHYRLKSNGSIQTRRGLDSLFPNTTKGANWPLPVADPIFDGTKPAVGDRERVRTEGIAQDVNDNWVWQYIVVSSIPTDPDQLAEFVESEKTRVARSITSKRIEVLSGGKSYIFPDGETGTVETTESDLLNLTAISNRAQQGDGAFVWKDKENAVHPLTSADAIALGNGVFDWQQNVWAHSFGLKSTVQLATDLATLDAIDIDTGWPE